MCAHFNIPRYYVKIVYTEKPVKNFIETIQNITKRGKIENNWSHTRKWWLVDVVQQRALSTVLKTTKK